MTAATITTTEFPTCYQCNNPIQKELTTYRVADTNQCSYKCMVDRLKYIETVDPDFKFPESWTNIPELYNETNNYKSSLKKTKSCICVDISDETNTNVSEKKQTQNKCVLCIENCFKFIGIIYKNFPVRRL